MKGLIVACLIGCTLYALGQSEAPKTIIVKVKHTGEETAWSKSQLTTLFQHKSIISSKPIIREESEFLNNVHVIRLEEGADPKKVCEELLKTGNIIYAEVPNQESLLAIPNDPLAQPGAGQSYLSVIKAYEAWDISQGSADIVIGISDTGIDFNHDDIKGNLYHNPDEIPNGLDDDENGYVDDINGYDFADGDSIAQVGASVHGNQVAGIAGAHTNNGVGIAGIGHKARISPLKMFTSANTQSIGAYESILYAADEGYDILNLSWGSVDTYSQAAQDIISYAVLEKNMVLVAAAGNTNELLNYYPASYDHVLSVGWTNQDDSKANNGTYSYHIDLMAPGTSILSTFKNNGYYADVGSSYAAPQVAGAAALVKAHYPNISALQIMEVLRVTTDDIYSIPANTNYYGKLGSGRLNVYKALTQDTLRSVRVQNATFSNDFGEFAFYGDTIHLDFSLQNFLFPIKNGKATLSTESPFVNLLTTEIALDFIDSMELSPLSERLLTLSASTPPNTTLPVRLDFQSGTYHDFQYLLLKTSPDYLNFRNSKSEMLVGGNGDIGYTENADFGLQYNGATIIRSLGMMAGTSKDFVEDNVLNNPLLKTRDGDFETEKAIKYQHYELAGHFGESTFKSRTKNLKFFQSVYFSDSADLQGVVVIRYQIANTGTDTLKDFQVGMYADWLLGNNTRNKGFYDSNDHFIYAVDSDSVLFGGIKIYEEQSPVHQSIDLANHNGNATDLTTDLTDSIKYELMAIHQWDSAGFSGIGNDIAQSISCQPFSIAPGSLAEKFFIIGASDNLSMLKSAFASADKWIDAIVQKPLLLETVYSCEGAALTIDPKSGNLFNFYSDVLRETLISSNDTLFTGVLQKDTTYFAEAIDSAYTSPIRRIDIKMIQNVALFTASTDTLYLDHPTTNRVTFTDKSFRANKWTWDFGNGVMATVQNPTANFTKPGTYPVSLSVVNELGCSDIFSKTLTIAYRPSFPILADQIVCKGEEVVLSDGDKILKVYLKQADQKPTFRGNHFTIEGILVDQTFYISQDSMGFESQKTEVRIQVDPVKAEIAYSQILTETTPVITLFSRNPYPEISWKVDGALSGQDSITIEVTKTSYEISLKVKSELGCSDSTTLILNFQKSQVPTVGNPEICKGSNYTLVPKNGKLFGFYEDNGLTRLITKSGQLEFKSLLQDTIVYVVGLDNVLPSDPVTVEIKLVVFEEAILANPEVLYLSEGKTATFKGSGALAERSWKLDGTSVALSDSIVLFFNTAGIYQVTLESVNTIGCKSLDTLSYQVELAPPLGFERDSDISVYPNPAKGEITLSAKSAAQITLFDMSGRQVEDFGELFGERSIPIGHLPSGIYLLLAKGKSSQSITRLILTN